MTIVRLVAHLLPLLLLAAPVFAASRPPGSRGEQRPSADWRTIETAHAVLHYPAPFDGWAREIASRIEPIHEAVATMVGYRLPGEKVRILVVDPAADANGMALPLLERPFLILWATPPESDSVIGASRDWGEMVAVHELAHVLHLTRPRNDAPFYVRWFLPVGPLALGPPRWVSEGYATLVEGKLTGSGRPNGAARAAMLRAWGAEGKLPNYDAMSSSGEWVGGSYAYLVGSAFLEWLEAREGEGSLVRLWKGTAGKRALGFDESFRRIFGRNPRDLYARFVAEITAGALAEEKRLKGLGLVDGTPWQRFSGGLDSPQLSPDGTRILARRWSVEKGSEFVVWNVEPTEKERKAEEKRLEKEKKRLEDPEEVADRPEEVRPREPEERLGPWDGRSGRDPRWLPDGRVLFSRKSRDPFGVLHDDLWTWSPKEGTKGRVTRFADVRMADPAPDGRTAVAIRFRFGRSELVRVDLASGEVSPLRLAGIPTAPFDVLGDPRLSPDGKTLVVARQGDGRWGLLAAAWPPVDGSLTARAVDLGDGAIVGPAAFSGDSSRLFVATDRTGTWNLEQVELATGGRRRLTSVLGAARGPAPTADGKGLFFVALRPDGEELRRLDLETLLAAAEPRDPRGDGRAAWPLYPPTAAPVAAPLGPAVTPEPVAYSALAESDWSWGAGARFSPSGEAYEPWAGGGDILGRFEWVVAGSLGLHGETTGGAAAARWRGLAAADLVARGFFLEMRPGEMDRAERPEFDVDRLGGELLLERKRLGGSSSTTLLGGALLEQVEPSGEEAFSRRLGWIGAEWGGMRRGQDWGIGLNVAGRGVAGESGDDGWQLARGEVTVSFETPLGSFSGSATEGEVHGDPTRFDLFTAGGGESSLRPEADGPFRAENLALPLSSLTGERLSRRRVSWGSVVTLYAEQIRVGPRDPDGPLPKVRLLGVEAAATLEDFPIRLGGRLSFVVGVARIYDDPLPGSTVAYGGLSIRP